MFTNDRISGIRPQLEAILGKENVRTDEAALASHSYDSGLSMAQPEAVVFISRTSQVAPVIRILAAAEIPFIPYMSGTNLTGGTIPLRGGVALNMSRLDKIIYINPERQEVLVEAGVINDNLQKALKPFGLFFAVNPASSSVCTIGGNIAENSSGTNWLAYGSACDSLLKLETVTPDGETHIWQADGAGPDLMDIVPGSEGTLCVITRAWLKVHRIPTHTMTMAVAFPTLDNALNAAENLLDANLPLSSLEILDKTALDASLKKRTFIFPHTMRSLIIADINATTTEELAEQASKVEQICLDNSSLAKETATEEKDRERLWDIRRKAFPSLAKIAPDIVLEESCVPREKLSIAVRKTREILRTYRLTAGIIISPGSGSIQPHIVFDRRISQDLRRVKTARGNLIKECLALGGSVAGDYGIGVDKRLLLNWLYSPDELDFLSKIKHSFDPKKLANPDKILPVNEDDAMFQDAEKNKSRPELDAHVHTILATLRSRADSRTASVILGSGTQLKVPPETEKLKMLDTRFLSMPPEINKANMTVRAGAGVNINDLRKILNDEGLDLQMPETEGTLGGIIASGRVPEIAKILLGMEIATAEGIYLNFTQQTLKAAKAYDICSLFCGSRGAYGVILSAVMQICHTCDRRDFTPTMPVPFAPEKIHRVFKKAVDPENFLNPWLYPQTEEQ